MKMHEKAPEIIVKKEGDTVDVNGASVAYEGIKIEDNITTTTTVTNTTTIPLQLPVKSEPVETQYNQGDDNQIPTEEAGIGGESFIIYEFEEAAPTSITATTIIPVSVTAPASLPTSAPVSAPVRVPRAVAVPEAVPILPVSTANPSVTASNPRILNTQLRKKRNVHDAATTSSAPSTPAKKPVNELQSTVHRATASKPTLPSSVAKNENSTHVKIKCFCSLVRNPNFATTTNMQELKAFFEQMFHETRQLSRSRQREVKMALLQAISEAEDFCETRRNCAKCCVGEFVLP